MGIRTRRRWIDGSAAATDQQCAFFGRRDEGRLENGIWRRGFGMAAWPVNAKLPNAVLTVAVRDSARARKIAGAIASSSGWQKSSRNNAEYYSATTSGVLAAVSPTLAVSDRLLAVGLDAASVDRVVTQAPPGNGLSG